MSNEIILGCDIGTGSCKVTACHPDGSPVQEVHSYYTTLHPQPGYMEQDPEVIKTAVVDCIRRILPLLPSSPIAMGFSSAMHSLMLVGDDDKPLTNLIVWEDNRSSDIAEELRSSDTGKMLYEKTGTPIHSMSPLCKIRWFREHQSELFQQAKKFIGIKEFLWHWMFGEYEVDISIASATGMMNTTSLTWEEQSLRFCETSESKLSGLVSTSFIRTNPCEAFVKSTGLPAAMKYCIGASDGCLANYSSGIDGPGKAALTIGTSGAVRITSGKPVINKDVMIFNYLLDKDIFICGGPVNNGGNVLLWLFRTFLKKDKPAPADFDELEKALADIPAGTNGLVCIPWFLGERAPVWDERASGVWMGVRNYHTMYHFFRAAVEGVCFTLRTILETIEEQSTRIDSLSVSGGFTRSPAWLQMMADITHKNIVISERSDASALGAILWTARAIGFSAGSAGRKDEMVVHPNPSVFDVLDKQYEVFSGSYRTMAPQMHVLMNLQPSGFQD